MDGESVAVGWTTFEDRESADEFARKLIERRVAACVQIDPPMQSVYSWKGRTCVDEEIRMWIKTTVKQAETMTEFLEQEHPYETPQWVWARAGGVFPTYGEWVLESVTDDGDA